MPKNRMQPETLAENRDRLVRMSQAEREGFEKASEGQLIPVRESIADVDGPESELHQVQDALRLRPAATDRSDQDAVSETQSAVVTEQVERRVARAEGRKPEVKQAAPRRKASKKSDA